MRWSVRIPTDSKKVSLADIPTSEHGPFSGKEDPKAAAQFAADAARMVDLQERLFAESKRSLLIVLQAMDTGGKDGTIRQVIGPLDNRGVVVHSFKAPNTEELAHDYLWRVHQRTPRRGEIAVFNRSHYEDVLAVRVLELAPKEVWSRRYEQINAFEKTLTEEGTAIVKIFLHISKDEQKDRLNARLADPNKHWKFEQADLDMRVRWDEFQRAYEAVFARTSTEHAPWHVVPADNKWFRNLAVARLICEALEALDPKYPAPKLNVAQIRFV